MSLISRKNPIARKLTFFLKRGKLQKSGSKAKEWKSFRDAKAERDKDNGQYYCHTIVGRYWCNNDGSLDLHHLVEREVDPSLYYEESNLIWLCRFHHSRRHV